MNKLIDDLLDVSRIESGSLKLSIVDLLVQPEIEEVVTSMQTLIDEKRLLLLMAIPSDLTCIRADRHRFRQIARILISNACQYSGDEASIGISAREDKGSIQIDVADSGIGISKENQAMLFTKFFRADNSLSREVYGIGLGLYIAKHLVEAQDGHIWVQALDRGGSTFSFTLPLANSDGRIQDSQRNQHRR